MQIGDTFYKRHPFACMVVALAILLALVIVLIYLAYIKLSEGVFLAAWLAIIIIAGFLLLKIIDWYEILEIQNYNDYRNKQKQRTEKPNSKSLDS